MADRGRWSGVNRNGTQVSAVFPVSVLLRLLHLRITHTCSTSCSVYLYHFIISITTVFYYCVVLFLSQYHSIIHQYQQYHG